MKDLLHPCSVENGLIDESGPDYPLPALEPVTVTEETNGQTCYEMESPKTCYQKDSQGYEVFYYTSKSVPRYVMMHFLFLTKMTHTSVVESYLA